MNILLVGEHTLSKGPAIANRNLTKAIQDKYVDVHIINFEHQKYQKSRKINKLWKAMRNSDVVVISTLSKINYFAVFFAKVQKKRIIYIAHGMSSIEGHRFNEQEYNELQNGNIFQGWKYTRLEKFMFQNSNKIFTVSKSFATLLKIINPDYSKKIDYFYNVTPYKSGDKYDKISFLQKKDIVVSFGGGRVMKNNIVVAKAIDELNAKTKMNIELIIAGADGPDTEDLKKYECVSYRGSLSEKEVNAILANAKLYVQNSTFESFSLAVAEASFLGANILISRTVGIVDLFKDIPDEAVINNPFDVGEIRDKIQQNMEYNYASFEIDNYIPNNGGREYEHDFNYFVTKLEEIVK
ncbi:glycosyltransferase family 4 protein [Dellaglioa sp. L3N]